jgi:peptidyl-dipeptidase Dcp
MVSPTAAAPVATLPADNPFAAPSPLPFGAPPFDRVRDEHFLPAFTAGMAQHLAEVRTIATATAPATFANTIEALERTGALLARVSKVFFSLCGTDSTEARRALQAEIAPRLAAHQDCVRLDRALFARIEAVFAQSTDLADPEQRRLVERYHTEFVRGGARLPAPAQERLRALNEEESSLVTEFQSRLLADTKDSAVSVADERRLAGLDAASCTAAAAAATAAGQPGAFLLTLQLPSSQAVLGSLQDRDLREQVFRASIARCSRDNANDTRPLVRRLATLRAERAALLAAADHATFVLADQMAGTPAAVARMLADLTPAIVAKARQEAAELQAHLDTHAPGTRLAAWDWTFVAEQVRQARLHVDQAVVRRYFELENVLQHGVFFMAEQLYGLRLRERHDLPVWHPDVRAFDVLEADGRQLGLFYADYFARPGKRGGAWMSDFVDQSLLLGQSPVIVNVMNLGKPAAGQPTLLGFDDVTTLFHEFGHALHGLCSRVRHPLLAGTAVPRDFVEFPSQFHEDFAFEPSVLARCARHHATQEPLPADLVDKVRRARRFGQGFASFEYLAATALDLAWHTVPPGTDPGDVLAFETAALQRAGLPSDLLALIPPRYRSSYFAHVWPGGYSASYYAYLWSEALAADAFAGLIADGGMTRGNGQRVRDAVLSRGFTDAPMRLYRDLMGREPDPRPLLVRRGLVS